jgi:hypothetical protein
MKVLKLLNLMIFIFLLTSCTEDENIVLDQEYIELLFDNGTEEYYITGEFEAFVINENPVDGTAPIIVVSNWDLEADVPFHLVGTLNLDPPYDDTYPYFTSTEPGNYDFQSIMFDMESIHPIPNSSNYSLNTILFDVSEILEIGTYIDIEFTGSFHAAGVEPQEKNVIGTIHVKRDANPFP